MTITAHEVPSLAPGAERVPSSAIRDLLSVARAEGVLSLAGGFPDARLLPVEDLSVALTHAGASTDSYQYGPTQGEPALREWIAAHELGGADPDRIVITQGAQQALSLVVGALVEVGTDVVVDAAAYVGMLQPLRRAGATLHAVPFDRAGLSTLALSGLLNAGLRPGMLHTVPTHHNPNGSVLSDSRRRQLGRLASEFRFVVVDDDPYRRLGATPPAPLRCHVPDDLAVTVGSFSKTVAPGLRVGWLHGPAWLVDAVVRLKQSEDLHSGSLNQRAVLDLVARDGWLDERCARLSSVYAARAAALVEALTAEMGDDVAVEQPRGGMFAWATFASDLGGSDRLARAALEEGVALVPSSAFDPWGRGGDGARLCFASSDEPTLRAASGRLARAVRRCRDADMAASSSAG
jgi:2-aminoadipate transaminase